MRVQPNIRRDGFTLVEILIVLAILALLAAIAFSVASRVREKGRAATCSSHLKQIALAMQQYVQDFDGQYPHGGSVGIDQKTWPSLLKQYCRDSQIFICPTRQALGGSNAPNGSPQLNYDYNFLRLTHVGYASRRLSGRGEAALPLTSQVWLNSDGDVDGSHSYPPGPSACGYWWWPRWGQELHSGGANHSFLDGHVKWLNPGQIEKIECALGDPRFLDNPFNTP